jgi:diaminohydroxyphosphoribosylaminopyrimidine deaminase/5-amino-6-(5-phosphoribosylamino)uracil reductase
MGDQSGERTKITGARSEQFTHFLRQCFDCVLIGRKTLLQDKPSLTVRRLQSDNVIKRNPSVIVLASSWGQEELSHLEKLAAENRTVITSCKASEKDLLEKKLSSVLWVETASNAETLPAVLAFAHDKGISSILVEGGATVHASLLQSSLFDASLVDRAFLFAARTDVAAKTPSFFPVKQLQGSNTLALRAFTGFDKELVADFY